MSVSNINVILKDLVYCDNCGAKMIIKKVREKYIIYCPKNAESKELCSNSTKMYYHKIENEALKKIVDYYNSHININVFKDKLLKKYIQNKVDGLEKYKKQLQKQLASVNFKISQIYNERLSEEIDNEQYKKVYTELTNERRQIDNDLTAVDEKIFGYTHKEERSIEKNKQEIYKIIDKIAEKKYSRDDIIKLIRRIRIDNNKIIFDYNFSNY